MFTPHIQIFGIKHKIIIWIKSIKCESHQTALAT